MQDTEGNFSMALEWLVERNDPKIICHPCVVLFADLLWNRMAQPPGFWRPSVDVRCCQKNYLVNCAEKARQASPYLLTYWFTEVWQVESSFHFQFFVSKQSPDPFAMRGGTTSYWADVTSSFACVCLDSALLVGQVCRFVQYTYLNVLKILECLWWVYVVVCEHM